MSHELLCKIVQDLPYVCSSPFEVSLFYSLFQLAFFRGVEGGGISVPLQVNSKGLVEHRCSVSQ